MAEVCIKDEIILNNERLAVENTRLKNELSNALQGLKFARDKLIEKEVECRNLKLFILKMSEVSCGTDSR